MNNTLKATPGEWFVTEAPYEAKGKDLAYAKLQINAPAPEGAPLSVMYIGSAAISSCHQGYIPCTVEEAEANARLFAAAKVMLEALRHILNGAVSLPRFAEDHARAAVAQATGEQQCA